MSVTIEKHPDPEVQSAVIRLADALCTWERNTGHVNILIIREDNYCFRAASGKPEIPDDISDVFLLRPFSHPFIGR